MREILKKRFISAMGDAAKETRVLAMRRDSCFGVMKTARSHSFRAFTEAAARNTEIRISSMHGSAGSKDEIREILAHGFCARNEIFNGTIQWAPVRFALYAAVNSGVDGDGIRHLLMCRVIMGKSELVHDGNEQVRSEFDSDVDNPVAPRKYFVSTSLMNSHILPVYVVSFKAPGHLVKYVGPPQKMINFLDLLPVLARSLPASKMEVLYKLRDDCKEKKISLAEMLREVTREVDRKVLEDAIKLVTPSTQQRNPFRLSNWMSPSTQQMDGTVSDVRGVLKAPTSSSLVPFAGLLSELERSLSPQKMAMLTISIDDFKARKINRHQLYRRMVLIAGKELLVPALASLKSKSH